MISPTLRVLYTLSNILFLLAFPSLCTENEASFPFDAEGKYKSYLDSILHYHGSRNRPRAVDTEADDATIAIIGDAFNTVRRNMTSTLGHKPRFAALYRSSFFNTSSLEAARHALYPQDTFEKGGPKKLGNVYGEACFAYGLDKCENHGRTAAECKHEEWLINFVLVVEYEKQHLSISIVEADRDGFGQSHSSFAAEFGEETGRALRDIGRDEYTARLSQFFEDAINKVINMRSMPYEREQIRAIVPVGETSSAAFAEVLGIAHKVVNNGMVRVLTDIDHAIVVAHGAAMKARDTVLRKDRWRNSGFEDEEAEHGHDEL